MTEALFDQWKKEDEIQGVDADLNTSEDQAPVEEDIFVQWEREDRHENMAETNLRIAEKSNPDEAAKIKRLSDESELPESAVATDPDGVEKALKRAGTQVLLTNPVLSAAYASSLAFAKVAYDDAGELATLEKIAGNITSEAKRITGNIGASYERGEQDTVLSELYDKKRGQILAGVEDADLDKEIAAATTLDRFEVVLDPAEKIEAQNIVETGLNAVASMVPLYKKLAVASTRGAAIYGPSMALLTGLNPVLFAKGALAGVTVETAKEIFKFEAGSAFREFSQERDENGDLLDQNLAAVGATAVGAINAGLEVASLGFLIKQAKVIPGVKQGLNLFVKGAVRKALTTQTAKTALVAATKRYAKAVTFEALTEGVQEITNILIGEGIKEVSEQIDDTYFQDIEWSKDFWPRVFEAFKVGGAAAGVLMFGPTVVQTANVTSKAVRAQKSKEYVEDTTRVQEAADATKTKERSPSELKNFVDQLDLPKEAYVSNDAVLFQENTEENSAILAKLGITREEMLDRVSRGMDIQIQTGDLHAKLTAQEFEILKDDLKPSPGSFSARDLKTFDMAVEAEAFSSAVKQEQVFNRQFQDEMTRLRKDARKLGFGNKYADDYVNVLERVADTFYPNTEDKINFAKRIKKIQYFKDVAPTAESHLQRGFLEGLKQRARLLLQTKDTVQGSQLFDPNTGDFIVNLFKDKDASTLLHETGHIFMNEMGFMVKNDLATEQVLEDYGKFKEWLGVEEGQKISAAQQEKFANAFEQYIYEGKAPTKDLIPTFQRFKNWLLTVYQKYVGRDALAPEVKELFDRMFTTKQSVLEGAANNDMWAWGPEQMDTAGVLQADKVYMKRLEKQSREQAEILMLKDMNSQIKQLKPAWRTEAELLLSGDRAYRHATFFREGTGIDIAALKEAGYNEEAVKQLSRSRIAKRDGLSILEAQTFSGYKTEGSLVDDMLSAPTKQPFIQDHIQKRTTEHILSFKPDDYLSQTKAYSSMLELKDRYIKRSMGVPAGAKPAKAVKLAAANWMAKQPVKDATRSDHFLSEQAKWSRKETAAVHAKKFDEASIAMENARFNYELARLAVKNKETVQGFEKQSVRLAKKDPKKWDEGFRDAVYSLIGLFDSPGKPRTSVLNEDVSILDYAYAQEKDAARDPFPLDPELVSASRQGTRYKDISMGALENLNELYKYLGYHGKAASEKTFFIGEKAGEKVGDIAPLAAQESAGNSVLPQKEADTISKSLTDVTRHWYAYVDSYNFVSTAMGGYQSIGKTPQFSLVEQLTYNKLTKAQEVKNKYFKKYQDKVAAPVEQILDSIKVLEKKHGRKMKDTGVETPAIMKTVGQDNWWTPTNIFALALNVGNKSNKARIFDGFPGFSETDLNILLDFLTEADWKAIEQIWRLNDEIFQDTSEVYTRVNKIKSERVETDKVQTKFGEIEGGYAPVRYDKEMARNSSDLRVSKIVEMNEKMDLMSRFESRQRISNVKANFMKTRVPTTPYPLSLSLSSITEHIADTAHYVAYAEAVNDAKNIMETEEMKQATLRHLGVEAYEGWKESLGYIANPRVQSKHPKVDRWIQKSRRWGTTAILAYNLNVARKQVFSAPAASLQIGKRRLALGYAKLLVKAVSSPRAVKEQYDFMMENSAFMKSRADSFEQEFRRQGSLLDSKKFNYQVRKGGKRYTYDDVLDFGFIPIKAVDLMTVMPIWDEAYRIKMEELGSSLPENVSKAVEWADHIVRSTQPTSESMDLTKLQRSGGGLSLLSMFGTFTIGKYQQRVRMNWRAFRSGKLTKAQFAERVLLEMVVPAIGIAWLNERRYLDDEEGSDWAKIIKDAMLATGTMMIPGAGPVIGNLFSPFPVSVTPVEGAIRKGKFAVKDVARAIEDPSDSEVMEEGLWSLAVAAGMAAGVPITNLIDTF